MTMNQPNGVSGRVNSGFVLEVANLSVNYSRRDGDDPRILDRVSMAVNRAEIIGLAGESGSGKSTLVESILRVLEPPRYVHSGRVLFWPKDSADPLDLMQIPESRLPALRWRHISYIPQGSMNSLNPVLRIGDQILDAMVDHGIAKREAAEEVPDLLDLVGLDPHVARLFPHQLSGGMKQRVVIAAAISMHPDLVIADEITTGLDVNVQRTILQMLMDIRDRLGVAILFVSHDMAVHAQIDDRLVLLYAGRVVEVGDVRSVFKTPFHPYVQGLIGSIPSLYGDSGRLNGIPGVAPSPLNWPPGCRFHPRCPRVMEQCRSIDPDLASIAGTHAAACLLYSQSRKEG